MDFLDPNLCQNKAFSSKVIDLHTELLVVQPTEGCLQDAQVSVELMYVLRDVEKVVSVVTSLTSCWSIQCEPSSFYISTHV